MNVYRLFMTYSGWQLAARFPNQIGNRVYVVKESVTKFGLWVHLVPFTGLPIRVSGPTTIPAGGRFPYGFAVEPD